MHSLAALNDWLETRCRELWTQTPHGSHPGAIADAWAEEVQRLMQLPRPFDGFVEHAKRVSPRCLIHLERNRYSVPAPFANRPVSVRVYPERIVVVAEGQIVCEHRRVFARSHEQKSTTTVYDWSGPWGQTRADLTFDRQAGLSKDESSWPGIDPTASNSSVRSRRSFWLAKRSTVWRSATISRAI